MQQAFCRFFVYDDFDNLLLSFEKRKPLKEVKLPFDSFVKKPYPSKITNIIRPTIVEQTTLIVCLKGRLLVTFKDEQNENVSLVVDKPIALNGQYTFMFTPLEEDVIYYAADVYNQTWEELLEVLPNKHATLADVVIAAV